MPGRYETRYETDFGTVVFWGWPGGCLMDESKCNTCGHYGLLKMIMGGAYGYGGDIPCLRCSEYIKPHSEYVPYDESRWPLSP